MNFLMSILCYFDRYNLLSCYTKECCSLISLVEQFAFPITLFLLFILMLVARFGFDDVYDWGERLIDWVWNDEMRPLPLQQDRNAPPPDIGLPPVLGTTTLPETLLQPQTLIERPLSVHSQARSHRSSVHSDVSYISVSSSLGTPSYSSRNESSTHPSSSHSSSIPELVPIPEEQPSPLPPPSSTTRRRRRRQL